MGIANNITNVADKIDVERVSCNANSISLEKKDSKKSDGLIIKNKLPITANRSKVKIKEMVMKVISTLLLMVSKCSILRNDSNLYFYVLSLTFKPMILSGLIQGFISPFFPDSLSFRAGDEVFKFFG